MFLLLFYKRNYLFYFLFLLIPFTISYNFIIFNNFQAELNQDVYSVMTQIGNGIESNNLALINSRNINMSCVNSSLNYFALFLSLSQIIVCFSLVLFKSLLPVSNLAPLSPNMDFHPYLDFNDFHHHLDIAWNFYSDNLKDFSRVIMVRIKDLLVYKSILVREWTQINQLQEGASDSVYLDNLQQLITFLHKSHQTTCQLKIYGNKLYTFKSVGLQTYSGRDLHAFLKSIESFDDITKMLDMLNILKK